MNSSDLERFGLTLAAMVENYDKHLTKAGIKLYFEAVSSLTVEQFESAASAAMRTCEWWPKPATILRLAGMGPKSKREQKETSAIVMANNAHEAWSAALNHIMAGKARYGETGIDDIDHTIRLMGGWTRMAEVKTEEIPFREREFIEKYKTWSAVERVERLEGKQILEQLGYNPKLIN